MQNKLTEKELWDIAMKNSVPTTGGMRIFTYWDFMDAVKDVLNAVEEKND